MLFKQAFRVLSPGGERGRLSILIFHRVLAYSDPIRNWDLDAHEFDRAIGWLKKWFTILSLDEAIIRLGDGSLPAAPAVITFDDGYADNYTVALPILKSHGLQATFFIATGFLDGGCMWNDTVIEAVRHCKKSRLDLSPGGLGVYELTSAAEIREAIVSILNDVKYLEPNARLKVVDYVATVAGGTVDRGLMMTSEQVRLMRIAGMSIGAHTVTHPILASLDPDGVRAEVLGSKNVLESLLQERVGLFAYPNGKPSVDYRRCDVDIVRGLGFDAAVTTAHGIADSKSDRMQLPRFTPWDRTKLRFGVRAAGNLLKASRLQSGQLAE